MFVLYVCELIKQITFSSWQTDFMLFVKIFLQFISYKFIHLSSIRARDIFFCLICDKKLLVLLYTELVKRIMFPLLNILLSLCIVI